MYIYVMLFKKLFFVPRAAEYVIFLVNRPKQFLCRIVNKLIATGNAGDCAVKPSYIFQWLV